MLCLDCFLNWSFCSFHHFKILSSLKWFVEENFGTFYYSPHEYLPWDRDIAKEGFLWPEKEESIKYWRCRLAWSKVPYEKQEKYHPYCAKWTHVNWWKIDLLKNGCPVSQNSPCIVAIIDDNDLVKKTHYSNSLFSLEIVIQDIHPTEEKLILSKDINYWWLLQKFFQQLQSFSQYKLSSHLWNPESSLFFELISCTLHQRFGLQAVF